MDETSPSSGEVLGSVASSTQAQVDAAVEAAAAAFETWRKTSVLDRVELCRTAFGICMERAEDMAQMISREVGKTIRESREEMVEYTADHFRRASEDVLRHAGQVLQDPLGEHCVLLRAARVLAGRLGIGVDHVHRNAQVAGELGSLSWMQRRRRNVSLAVRQEDDGLAPRRRPS